MQPCHTAKHTQQKAETDSRQHARGTTRQFNQNSVEQSGVQTRLLLYHIMGIMMTYLCLPKGGER